MILRLSLDMPVDREYVRTTRLLSRALLEDLKVLPEDTDAIELIIGELCTNVVRHAAQNKNNRSSSASVPGETAEATGNDSEQSDYQVILEYHKEKLLVTVEDKGPGFDLEAIAEPGTARPDSLAGSGSDKGNGAAVAQRLGGFGIPLIAALSDALNFEATNPNGTKVRAEKKLRYQSPQAEQRAAKMDESNHGQGARIEATTS